MGNLKKINIDGTIYTTELTKKFENRKPWVRPNPKHIKSFIPGTIVDISVKEGQKVKEGETIMILEAMKMKSQIKMPFDGIISKINVVEGSKVPNRLLMVEIE